MVSDTERLLDKIGNVLSEETGYPQAQKLLYARVKESLVGHNIFINHDDQVEYVRSSVELSYLLLDLWEENDPDKRWAEIEYLLHEGRFTADFIYPGQFDPTENFFERRDRVVARHFGGKPIVYPPWPDDDVDPTFEL